MYELPIPTEHEIAAWFAGDCLSQCFGAFCAAHGLKEVAPDEVVGFPYHNGVGAVGLDGRTYVLRLPDMGAPYWVEWPVEWPEDEDYDD